MQKFLIRITQWLGDEHYTSLHLEMILWGVIVVCFTALVIASFVGGCTLNTLYDVEGTGIKTVLWLANVGSRLLIDSQMVNEQGLIELSATYGVDIHTAFTDWAAETRTFLATVRTLRQAIQADLDAGGTHRAITGATPSELDRTLQELDRVLEQVPPINESPMTDTWEQSRLGR